MKRLLAFVISPCLLTSSPLFSLETAGFVEGSIKKFGLPAALKGKLSVEMLTYISDELIYDYIVAVDIDPAVFDFEPDSDRSEEKNADSVTIDFLSKILFPHDTQDVALADAIGNVLSPEKIRREMFFVPRRTTTVNGTENTTRNMPSATISQGGVPIQSNFPSKNTVSPFVTGRYEVVQKAFYIDRRPVTNREFREFVRATGRVPPKHWDNLTLSNYQKDDPVVNISYEDAAAYASWVGKRLPELSELQRAALLNGSIRYKAPLYEWTSTTEGAGHFRYGKEPSVSDNPDSNTGFRTALDG